MPAYVKRIIEHPSLYIVAFTKNKNLPCMIFIHGGPGLNSGALEGLIEHESIFDALEFDIILYDQRACGRSKTTSNTISHLNNLDDLEEICKLIRREEHYNIAAIIGHSYGAKVLFDYIAHNPENKTPTIFISTAPSILTPRINNLLMDLSYLKQVDPEQYEIMLSEFENLNYDKLWELTEKITAVFHGNKNRPYLYWANLKWKEKVQNLHDHLNLPLNKDVFSSVRKDLYSKPDNYSVDIDSITDLPCLWINGFHDLIINGAAENPHITKFYKSAHYPHIEENERFCEVVNNFLRNSRSKNAG